MKHLTRQGRRDELSDARQEIDADAVVLGVYSQGNATGYTQQFDEAADGVLSRLLEAKEITGKQLEQLSDDELSQLRSEVQRPRQARNSRVENRRRPERSGARSRAPGMRGGGQARMSRGPEFGRGRRSRYNVLANRGPRSRGVPLSRERIMAHDKDGDGELSEAERDELRQAIRQRIENRRTQRFDAYVDRITSSETPRHARRAPSRRAPNMRQRGRGPDRFLAQRGPSFGPQFPGSDRRRPSRYGFERRPMAQRLGESDVRDRGPRRFAMRGDRFRQRGGPGFRQFGPPQDRFRERGPGSRRPRMRQELLQRFDIDDDGRLSESERAELRKEMQQRRKSSRKKRSEQNEEPASEVERSTVGSQLIQGGHVHPVLDGRGSASIG